MFVLGTAVITASLLGSMHCVGMCGPLALWASGAGDKRSWLSVSIASVLYHLGRLLTYVGVGALAGAAGELMDLGGNLLGIQLVAARLVGLAMLGIAVVQLVNLLTSSRFPKSAVEAKPPSLIARGLARIRPRVRQLPLAARGLVVGMLTTFLPCGWLYLFALVASGTGQVVAGMLVMAAFWIGTVPALVGLVAGSASLAGRFKKAIPVAVALLLGISGCYTAAGRGFAHLESLTDIRPPSRFAQPGAWTADAPPEDVADNLSQLTQTPLPCCAHGAAEEPSP